MILSERQLSEEQPSYSQDQEFDWDVAQSEGADNQPYLPSPWEIQEICREIRSGWSEAEHRRRAGYISAPLQLAVRPCRISLCDVG